MMSCPVPVSVLLKCYDVNDAGDSKVPAAIH